MTHGGRGSRVGPFAGSGPERRQAGGHTEETHDRDRAGESLSRRRAHPVQRLRSGQVRAAEPGRRGSVRHVESFGWACRCPHLRKSSTPIRGSTRQNVRSPLAEPRRVVSKSSDPLVGPPRSEPVDLRNPTCTHMPTRNLLGSQPIDAHGRYPCATNLTSLSISTPSTEHSACQQDTARPHHGNVSQRRGRRPPSHRPRL